MNSKKSFVVLVMVAVAILSFWVGWEGISDISKSNSYSDWKTAEGIVINSQVVGERALHPEIEYNYEVDGVVFEGKTNLSAPGFGTKANRRDQATKLVAQYSPGMTITIYFNPANPGESVLRPYPIWSAYTRTGSGFLIFAVIGLMLGYKIVRGNNIITTK